MLKVKRYFDVAEQGKNIPMFLAELMENDPSIDVKVYIANDPKKGSIRLRGGIVLAGWSNGNPRMMSNLIGMEKNSQEAVALFIQANIAITKQTKFRTFGAPNTNPWITEEESDEVDWDRTVQYLIENAPKGTIEWTEESEDSGGRGGCGGFGMVIKRIKDQNFNVSKGTLGCNPHDPEVVLCQKFIIEEFSKCYRESLRKEDEEQDN